MNSPQNTEGHDEPEQEQSQLDRFKDSVEEMTHVGVANAATRFVLMQLIEAIKDRNILTQDYVKEMMYEFIDIEALDRKDPLVRVFGHMCCSFYLVMQNMKDGRINKEQLEDALKIAKGIRPTKSKIIMPN